MKTVMWRSGVGEGLVAEGGHEEICIHGGHVQSG